ncbi:MAG: hypothetical protein ABIC68_02015 [Candidatus Omnitrophota bacterium]
MMISIRFIKVFNYGLAGLGILIFLLISATFFSPLKLFLVNRWLGGERLACALLPDVFLKVPADIGSSYNMDYIRGRRLFVKTLLTEPPPVKKIIRDDETLKNLRLVAIIHDGGAKVAIEDRNAARTYFVSVDEYCAAMRVVEIEDNKVILEKEGEFYSLVM